VFQWVGPTLIWIFFAFGLILMLGGATEIILKNRQLVRAGQNWAAPILMIGLAAGAVYIFFTR
jgi:hypothetical protein